MCLYTKMYIDVNVGRWVELLYVYVQDRIKLRFPSAIGNKLLLSRGLLKSISNAKFYNSKTQ